MTGSCKILQFTISLLITGLLSGMLAIAQSAFVPNPADYSVPTWTKILRMLEEMKDASQPYNVSLSINGDLHTSVGIAWFTNATCSEGKVQLSESPDFTEPMLEVQATSTLTPPLNYANTRNELAGIPLNEKIVYTSHKALVEGLQPGTRYYYRVGNEEGWSDTGSFRISPDTTEYSFIYITDTQGKDEAEFDVSRKTMEAAISMVPDAEFILFNGDFVESWGKENSEWEYEQWFSSMQHIWMNHRLAATPGNHDKTPNCNFYWHFNTDNTFAETAAVKPRIEGTTYSFELGDVLYMVLYYEDDDLPGYLEGLGDWMREVVSKSTAKWRVVSFHTDMFTGSWHQGDANQLVIREKMLPVFEELDIDIAIQGHDHLYEVIGPVRSSDMTLVEEAVTNVEDTGDAGSYANMTGKAGGTFDVSEGTLYFLNNSACKKKYWPLNEQEMINWYDKHKIPNYFSLFSGRLGQTGEPTFSRVDVTSDKFTFNTYTVDDEGNAYLFDSIEVVKKSLEGSVEDVSGDTETRIFRKGDKIVTSGIESQEIVVYNTLGTKVAYGNGSEVDISHLPAGTYTARATSRNANNSSTTLKFKK